MPIPLVSQSGSFWNSFLFNQFNISRVDIPCVLKIDAGGAVRSTQRQPVTLYITVTALANKAAPGLSKSHPNIPTEDDDFPAGIATTPGRVQFPAAEPLSLPSHHLPVETGTPMPQNLQEMSSLKSPRFDLHRADETMKSIERSNTWERAVGRINWVMNTLGPIADVRTMPFLLFLTRLTSIQLFPLAKMAHSLLSAIPKVNPFASYS